jgi:PKD repeat protein
MKYILLIFFSFFSTYFLIAQEKISPDYQYESNLSNTEIGKKLGSTGDLNGDGYEELFTNQGNNSTLIFNGNNELKYIPNLTLPFPANLTHGDLNNDGYEDLIFGNYGSNEIVVYYGKSGGLASVPDFQYKSTDGGDFGYSVDATGDINNDGYDDLVVGQPKANRGSNLYGKVYVFLGSKSGLKNIPDAQLISTIPSLGYGSIVRYAGDINNDNKDDILISGMPITGVVPLFPSFTDIFIGTQNGKFSTPANTIYSGTIYSISKAGDVNHDSYDDFVITALDEYFAKREIIVYKGDQSISLTDYLFYQSGSFSQIATGIGDFNHDTFDDIIITDPEYNFSGDTILGRIDIYLGRSSGIEDTSRFYFNNANTKSAFNIVPFTGDLDNDGFSDVILASPDFSSGEDLEGTLYIFKGRTSAKSDFTMEERSVCESYQATFNNHSNADAKTFFWDFGDGNTSSIRNPIHIYNKKGIYYVTLKAYDSRGFADIKKDSIIIQAPLSTGNYTLGGVGADFESIGNFNYSLGCGAIGEIVVNVNQGIYQEELLIQNLNKRNHLADYHLSFISDAGNTKETIIKNAKISNSSNLLFKGITFLDTVYRVITKREKEIFLITKSKNITIDDCGIFNSPRAESSGSGIKIDSSSQIIIKNSNLGNRERTDKNFYSINGVNSEDISILNNTFYGDEDGYVFLIPISISASKRVIINDNRISASIPQYIHNGIHLILVEGFSINRNVIYSVRNALLLERCRGNSGFNLVSNNSFGDDISANEISYIDDAVSFKYSSNINFYNNTICLDELSTNVYCMNVATSDSINIKNNIFKAVNPNSACLNFNPNFTKQIVSDYNYFSGNVNKEFFNQFSSLKEWRNFTKMDWNSISGPIGFISPIKLIPSENARAINEAGFTLPEVTKDIQLNDRGPITSDMGAYEITSDTINDARNPNIVLFKIVQDSLFMGKNEISLEVTNCKKVPVDSIVFSYRFGNETSNIMEKWVGKLNYQDTLIFKFSVPFEISKGKNYSIVTQAFLGAGVPDADSSNNILMKDLYARLEGTYTVYGDDADFKNITEANYHLSKSGAKSKVTFLIRPGFYDDILDIGSSVEYKSETGRGTDVSFPLGNCYHQHDATIRHITLTTGTNIVNSSNISFENCIFRPLNTLTPAANSGMNVQPSSSEIKFRDCSFEKFNFGIHLNSVPYIGDENIYGNFLIKGCTFDSVTYPIMISCVMRGKAGDSLIIENNKMKFADIGIYIISGNFRPSTSGNVRISDNLIDSCNNTGIHISQAGAERYKIHNNKIHSLKSHGIQMTNLRESYIFNNQIITKETGNYPVGIYANDCHKVKVYNNSLIGGFNISKSSLEVFNNSCYSDSSLLLAADDSYRGAHNNFFRKDNGPILDYEWIISNTIDTLISLGVERYSISTDPLYVSNSDLHSLSPKLKLRGKPFEELSFDYDYQKRNSSNPDIGADEIDLPPFISRPQLIQTYPLDNSVDIDVNTPFVLTFDRKIYKGYGQIEINYYENNVQVEFPYSKYKLIDTNKIEVNLVEPLLHGKEYYVTFSKDLAYAFGMGNEAIDNQNLLNFKTVTSPPVLQVLLAEQVKGKSALVLCQVIEDGGMPVTEQGICYGKLGETEIIGRIKSPVVEGENDFNCLINELISSTNYWVQAYAINSIDTAYSEEYIFYIFDPDVNGIKNYVNPGITIYPNPVQKVLNIDCDSPEKGEVVIYNQLGNETSRFYFYKNSTLNLENYPSGIYFIKINISNRVYHRPFIKN